MTKNGLFVGAITLDLIYLTTSFPEKNQKIVATEDTIAAGGPATNAAVTYSYLGDRSLLVGVVGHHAIAHLIRADLEAHGVRIVDLDRDRSFSPPISSIIVTQSTGDRAVVSINARFSQGSIDRLPSNILQGIDIVMLDGHQMACSARLAEQAKANNIPVVMDGGSWKPGLEEVLPFVDYAVCSANFYPPNCHNQKDVFTYLANTGIPYIAITQGEKPIQYLSKGTRGELKIPQIKAVDTLGAGDIFHGAFSFYILRQKFINSLAEAAKIASFSCQFFGTRQWMEMMNDFGTMNDER